MFCPNCGIDDKRPNQFCRACGADIRSMLGAVGNTDNITRSAVSAREDIGRAVAAKIRETNNADELKIVTDSVLPELEKFLQSPAEKRLNRIRQGAVVMLVGIGATIAFGFLGLSKPDVEDRLLFIAALGVVAFCVGFALFVNGIFFSSTAEAADAGRDGERQTLLDSLAAKSALPEPSVFSTTEHTTEHLEDKIPVLRKR